MDNSSNSTNATNGIGVGVGNSAIFTDKPDELVSSAAGNIQPQLQSLLQLHPHLLPTFQLSPQQKKCLHRRILMQTQTMTPQSTATFTPAVQRAFPMQQQHHHSLASQIIAAQQNPTAPLINGHVSPASVINVTGATSAAAAALISAVGNSQMNMINANAHNNNNNNSHHTSNTNTTTTSNSSSSSNGGNPSTSTVPIVYNQNGLVQQLNAALLADRYLLMDLVEGSTLYKCIDVKTHEELVCKVSKASATTTNSYSSINQTRIFTKHLIFCHCLVLSVTWECSRYHRLPNGTKTKKKNKMGAFDEAMIR